MLNALVFGHVPMTPTLLYVLFWPILTLLRLQTQLILKLSLTTKCPRPISKPWAVGEPSWLNISTHLFEEWRAHLFNFWSSRFLLGAATRQNHRWGSWLIGDPFFCLYALPSLSFFFATTRWGTHGQQKKLFDCLWTTDSSSNSGSWSVISHGSDQDRTLVFQKSCRFYITEPNTKVPTAMNNSSDDNYNAIGSTADRRCFTRLGSGLPSLADILLVSSHIPQISHTSISRSFVTRLSPKECITIDPSDRSLVQHPKVLRHRSTKM
jgi:hypothetical protein